GTDIAQGAAPEPPISFLPAFLRAVGTFDVNNPVEKTHVNQQALGKQGFNPSSLIGIFALGPYTHNGSCQTLACVLDNPAHRSAGVGSDVLANPQDRAALAQFLRSIDVSTRPVVATGFAVTASPGNLRVARTQSA